MRASKKPASPVQAGDWDNQQVTEPRFQSHDPVDFANYPRIATDSHRLSTITKLGINLTTYFQAGDRHSHSGSKSM